LTVRNEASESRQAVSLFIKHLAATKQARTRL
jgi:hypothetical protein